MKIILLAQYFEIFQISSSGKSFTKTFMNKMIFHVFVKILPDDEI